MTGSRTGSPPVLHILQLSSYRLTQWEPRVRREPGFSSGRDSFERDILGHTPSQGGSVAEWLACWTQAQKGLGSNRSRDVSGNSLRQTVHTHRASVHPAAKLVAALLRVAGVTADLAESNGSLPPGL